MAANYGAHEIMELHEVLTDTIDGINQFQLYRPHCQDPELRRILDNQIQFMMNEYNMMVNALNQRGINNVPSYKWFNNASPTYGLHHPSPQSPNASMNQMDDRDVASGMLGCSKASAGLRMHAALECADPELRRMLIQGAVNCAEQAYETWSYMNKKGYYQVPTMKQMTTNTMMGVYQPGAQGAQAMQQ
ncbi:spore coat protein [Bacillaceae bacterium]